MENEVLFSVSDGGTATITLNRPKALNSLSTEMLKPIGEKLKEWQANDEIHLIILRGSGEKGFCAGGDIKTLYNARSSQEAFKNAEVFFEEEYQVDMAIYHYPKPIIACLDGIVMGGGVGLTFGASHRIVTERTKWAMPEMNIGFFPDVGAAYFLNKAPGFVGYYLALTASVIQAADVLFVNGADSYMTSDKLHKFLTRIEQTDWHTQEISTALNQLIEEYSSNPLTNSELASLQNKIDQHFSNYTIEEIVASLDNDASKFSHETKQLLLSKSPSSLKITLQQLIDARDKTLKECFATDLILAKNFLKHEDFFEGVRSVVIDKDRNPQYTYKTLAEFTDEDKKKFFHDNSVKS
ncbi:enoyl-CoA hydratase/isomerase family protein [Lysinibacillus sphaericus]|uniref:3-hydroxyisobutyryl-CoA hydrolase n=1 Tax=Lysinibacillus sphaericus TaxID=1421 RepID=A0A544UQD0_LYSSH|nr:enoyl-CoA hydratase/isomerase family protein [Lysinibacillus sp. SDF0037]TQR36059.1 enoyl-CoA hydratase/isomerase family protein [Lysinibacillus sp. SDF0037]